MSSRQTAIVGGGIAGVTAAWELHRQGRAFRLFEASSRLGGTVETVRRNGFTIECGPDGWVSEKPWARELAIELGLESELIGSNDATRVTYIVNGGKLVAMPDGMRMMVPTDLALLEGSQLFTDSAREAYARESASADLLRASAPTSDESVASFVERHFGREVLEKLAAPLLSGVFGGDVATLSVRAVMPTFVEMEREYGSLIVALQAKRRPASGASIFTTLRSGTQTLIDRMVAEFPSDSAHCECPVDNVLRKSGGWRVEAGGGSSDFDELILATPAHVTRKLLGEIVGTRAADLLQLESTSAVVVAFAFGGNFELPEGFGFVVPPGEANKLLAATFVDQKYPGRCPAGGRLIRAFFGGGAAPEIGTKSDAEIAAQALGELESVLGRLPTPAFSVVRRWPESLPQYAVGHLDRVGELEGIVSATEGLWLVGNAYHGVGLADLVRDARAAAREIVGR